MPFLKFGKKKSDEDEDLEAPEESGLLMTTKGNQPGSAGEPDPEPASPEPVDELDSGTTQDQPTVVVTPGGAAAEEVDPLLDAALADPDAEDQTESDAEADTGESKESDAADLMSAFTDDETYGDLTNLIKDIEDIAAIALLEELREVRAMLPPEVLDEGESVA